MYIFFRFINIFLSCFNCLTTEKLYNFLSFCALCSVLTNTVKSDEFFFFIFFLKWIRAVTKKPKNGTYGKKRRHWHWDNQSHLPHRHRIFSFDSHIHMCGNGCEFTLSLEWIFAAAAAAAVGIVMQKFIFWIFCKVEILILKG